MAMVRCVLLACAALIAAPAQGADTTKPPPDPWQNLISPDRPGAATPPSVMDRGVFQLETSLESQTARLLNTPDVTTLDFPTLARYGVGHGLEFRLEAGISGLLGWALRDGTTLALDTDMSRVVQSSGGPYVWQLGSQGAFEIPVRRNWAFSGDVFVSSFLQNDSTTPWGADAGVEYYPNPDTQLDLVAIHTFTEPGTATSVQLGLSRRIGARR